MSSLPPLNLRTVALIAVVVIVGWLGYKRLTARSHDTPEGAIAAVLDDGAAAARDGRVKDLMSLVSGAYHGGDDGGPVNRDDLRAYLFVALARGAEVRFLSRDIVVDGATAHVTASMIVIVGGRGLVDGRTGARDFELELAREGDAWKVVSARTSGLSLAP